MIDFSSKLGARAEERLKEEKIIWLTTISSTDTPQPNPVWFFWDGESLIVYSQPTSFKVQNITRNPKVSLNFHADEEGGDVVVLTGEATVDKDPPAPDPRYLEKYREEIPKIGLTPETMAASYSVLIRVLPKNLRGM
jgi:PPOX class probable F420-dependent enzyme